MYPAGVTRFTFHVSRFLPLALLTLATLPLTATAQNTPTTLRQAADRNHLLIGAAIMSHHLDNPDLARLIATQFNSLTGENEFKPASLHPAPGQWNFAPADRIAAFAHDHDMKLVGHNLLWHSQGANFLFQDENRQPLPREKALANLKDHVDKVLTHFKGQCIGWDVVNEALSDNPNEYLRDTPAKRAIGDDYVLQTFKLARAADPDVQLYYNDYSIEYPGKREKALRLIKELKAGGADLYAVGIQGHALIDAPAPDVFDAAITAFQNAGVKVMITELDVDPLPRRHGSGADVSATEKQSADPYKTGLPDDVQKKLADRYAALFNVFLHHKDAVTRITLWGTHDGTSWLNSWPVRGRTNHPLLWDRHLHPKPAYTAVLDTLTAANP